jgi:hypothetical protein
MHHQDHRLTSRNEVDFYRFDRLRVSVFFKRYFSNILMLTDSEPVSIKVLPSL